MRKQVQRVFACLFVLLLVLSISIASVIWAYNSIAGQRQREAENILFYYKEKIVLQLQGTINEATALAQTAQSVKSMHADVTE